MSKRINWILFSAYALVTAVLFAGALVSPGVRMAAPAPLRDAVLSAVLPPVKISVLYSSEKEAWLEEIKDSFNGKVNGRPIELEFTKMGSRDIYLAVLEGRERPDLISPASSLQIAILQDQSARKFGRALVNVSDRNACRSVVNTPLVVVAWRERAEVLGGGNLNGNMWLRLGDALVDETGWSAYQHPEWGFIKFGHTDPRSSNSGFMTILLMTYNYFGKTDGLSAADLDDPGYRDWFLKFENSILEFGDSTGNYMKDMVAMGPSAYDIVAVYESTAIEHAENARGRYGELRVYYPPATTLSDHPFCVLNADWVTSEKAQAAHIFVDYLLAERAQELALMKYGFRPVNPAIPLDQPGSPFNVYTDAGLQIDLPPEVEIPAGNVLDKLLDFWIRNVPK